MGVFSRFIAVVTCRSCTTVDEKALEERNKLRKKVGKNKIAPQAKTDLDVKIEKTERIETDRKESPTSWDIFTVEKKDEIVAGDIEQREAALKSEQSVGGDSTTRSLEEKAGGDTALYEFALNYVKTLVIPGALEKFRAEEDRDKHNVSVASSGGYSDSSTAASDIVKTSLANAQELLKREQMPNNDKERLKK